MDLLRKPHETKAAFEARLISSAIISASTRTNEDVILEHKLYLAGKTSLTEEEVYTLAKDDSWLVRVAVAERDVLSERIKQLLSNDEVPYVRRKIAERGDLTNELVEHLLNDNNNEVRFTIACKYPNYPGSEVGELSYLIDNSKDEISKLYFTLLNCFREGDDFYEYLKEKDVNPKYDPYDTKGWGDKREYIYAFPNIIKYISISETERNKLNLCSENENFLRKMLMIRENPDCLPNLRLREQEIQIMDKQADYSRNLDNCPAVYPDTRERVWNRPPYTVTDVRFSTPPYAGGLPLSECPGWENGGADWGHVDSISIQDGTGVLRTFSGEEIDSENRIVFEWKDFQVKYGIETGRVEFSPRLKQTVTLPSAGLEDAIREYISSPGDEVSRRTFRMVLDGMEGLSSERKIELFADAEVRRQEISTGKTESHKLSRGL